MVIWHHREYRDYLKSLLRQRKELNPQYSLRAFARDVGASFQITATEGANFNLSDLGKVDGENSFCLEGPELPQDGSPFSASKVLPSGSKSGVSIGNQ